MSVANHPPYEAKPLVYQGNLQGISEKTNRIHHDKLYAGYVAKMNEVSEGLKSAFQDLSVLDAANQSMSQLRSLRDAETWSTNAVRLHEYYFDGLGSQTAPSGSLADAINEKWESYEKFAAFFSATGMAVRGWVVLAWDLHLGRLKIYGVDAHNQGGVWGCIPLLVLDVYEHAYFLDYGSDRKAYIADWWKNLDWSGATARFEKFRSLSL
jgi:Fe-Mn family superoxide dismutase